MTRLMEVDPREIKIGERYRKEYDLNDDFLDSIREKGILQPITLSQELELIAGGRRLTAALELGLSSIPALLRDVDGELDLRECELLENIQRKDLVWHERVALIARIHALGEERSPNWSQRKTAKALARSVGGINRALELSRHIEDLPMLKDVENEDKAVKIIRKMKEHMAVKALAADHKKSSKKSEGTVPSQKAKPHQYAENHFHVGDAFAGMQEMLDCDLHPPIALVEVDPPYGINLKEQKKGDGDYKLNIYEEVESEKYESFLDGLCEMLYATTPEHTRVIFWFGIEWYQAVKDALTGNGFRVDPIPCIWVKPSGQTNSPDLYLARSWEPFFVAWKGDGIPINKRGRVNTFTFNPVPHTKKYHPTQRPIELMQEILRTFAWPGSLIMVPFLGSGTTLIAAYREKMIGFGWELNEENKEPFLAAVQRDLQENPHEYDTNTD